MEKKALILLILVTAFNCLAAPANLKGCKYVGIAKVNGSPIDFWVSVEFDTQDAEVNVGNAYNFFALYTASGDSNTITIDVPGSPKCILKSQDKGESCQGTLTINGNSMKLWLLKIPRKLKIAEVETEELRKIVSSPEGYTSFVQLSKGGGLFCVTSDFFFHKDGLFEISCDSPSLQQIFENMRGRFDIEGSQVNLNLNSGASITGTIYDNGNYISIPVGTKDGMDMTVILIR